MKKYLLILIASLVLFIVPFNSTSIVKAQETATIQIVRADIDEYLSQGGVSRVAYTSGESESANFLANKMRNLGLEYFSGDSYLQTFGAGDETSQNVIGVKQSSVSDNIVILGAHYDSHKDALSAVYDNASGVSIVLALMEALKDVSLPYDVVYIFYGAEEVGMKGSNHFVESLSALITKNILLAMNFDSIGVGEYTYYFAGDTLNGHKKLFENNSYNIINYPEYPRANYLAGSPSFGYGHIGLQSDNLSYVSNSIRSITFFSGNATDVALGFRESAYNDNVHHTKNDNLNYILEVYPDFINRINNVANLTFDTLTSSNFYTEMINMSSGINLNFFSDKIIIVCVGLIGLLFVNRFLTQKVNKSLNKN